MNIADLSTLPPENVKKEAAKERTEELLEELKELQNLLFAGSKYSLLIVLQGMDASGKDGAVKSLYRGLNPMGVDITSFKAPSEVERKHDFLWRIHQKVPQSGMIEIFNRSHYEDVLVPVVKGWIDSSTTLHRYRHINNFESLLESNNTLLFKFYLHISEEEQRRRFEERKVTPHKRWKYNLNDLAEAKSWPEYRKAYNKIFHVCQEPKWTIVPADKNWYRDLVIAEVLVNSLKKLNMKYPEPN